MARRHRCVAREDEARGGLLKCLLKRELMLLFQPVHAFQPQKCGVALVHVVHRRLQSQRFQGAIPADAEEDFLFQAHFEVTAVKLVGDDAVLRMVGRKVGIQQEE